VLARGSRKLLRPDFRGGRKKPREIKPVLVLYPSPCSSTALNSVSVFAESMLGISRHSQLGAIIFFFFHFPDEMLRFREMKGLAQEHTATRG
jgi:hypothetical protein